MTFGEQLRKLVKSKGLNFVSLASKMGVTNGYLSQLVVGIRKPGRETLLKLAKALEVPIDALLMLGASSAEDNTGPRKIPVLNETGINKWMNSEQLPHPILYAEKFEYASTIESHAFYFMPSNPKGSLTLDLYDLILIAPKAAINNGDTVLICASEYCSLGKIVIAHGITIFLNEKQEQIHFFGENGRNGICLFRAIQGIKNI